MNYTIKGFFNNGIDAYVRIDCDTYFIKANLFEINSLIEILEQAKRTLMRCEMEQYR